MRMGLVCVAALGLWLTGCGGVQSDHPLSSEADSVLDKRLIGTWELVPKKKDEEDKAQPRLYVGKRKGSKNVLELVTLDMDDDKHIEVRRYRIHTTRLGEAACLSLGDDSQKAWFLIRYTLDDKGRLFVQALDEQKVADAIQAKKIAGRVKEHDKDEKRGLLDFRVGRFEEVRLTAPTKALRAWLAKAPGAWSPLDKDAGHFRKLDFKIEIGGN